MVDLKVECSTSGYHSGEVGGIVPETFRIIRALLDRIDDTKTGRVVEVFQSPLPEWKLLRLRKLQQAKNKTFTENSHCRKEFKL